MKMKFMLISLSLGLGAAFSSCTKDAEIMEASNGTGMFKIDVVPGTTFLPTTRAVNENSYKTVDNYTLEITDASGASKFSGTYAQLQNELPMTLKIGSYNIKAYYGTESAASRTGFYVEGSSSFTIKSNETTQASVTCEPTCGKVLAAFNNEMNNYFSDYSVAFYGTAAIGSTDANAAVWAKADTDPYYLKLNQGGETVSYKIHLTTKEGFFTGEEANRVQSGVVEGTFTLNRNEAHKLTIGPNLIEDATGNLAISITIDESTNDKEVNIIVPITWIEKQ